MRSVRALVAVLVATAAACTAAERAQGPVSASGSEPPTATTADAPTDPCDEQPCPGDAPPGAPHCSTPATTEHQIAYEVPGMDDVHVECDIVYKEILGLDATLDLYLPAGAAAGDRLPAVVFVHGNEDLPEEHPVQTHWKRWEYTRGLVAAALGYVGITFDYRGYNDARTMADAEQDVLDLLSYVGSSSDELMVDPDRICIWGTSGGGYPAAWGALFGNPQPRCAVMFSASLDSDFSPDRDPAMFVDASAPPFFVARGAFDDYGSVTRFIDRARAASVDVTFLEHSSGAHGFENEADPEQQRIVRRAFDFVARHLAAG